MIDNKLSKKQFLQAGGLAVFWTAVAGLMACSGKEEVDVKKAATAKCAECPMKARYDRDPRSIISRIWKWHIKWCPGWKSYLASLPEDERKKVIEQYK
ncbi:MAG: hypothetical protein JW807_09825 [Spirochaetes bacterium]|nr:hypothetical protein [Spirochaetota bacterium]